MRLGDIANRDAAHWGKPLAGVRILAVEQMQALPFATQLLARLGADVVKVEHPTHGESGRGATPAMADPSGRPIGATFLRNNLNKRSVGIDLKHPRGRDLVLRLAARFDVLGENFKAGTMRRLGLGYDDVARVHPRIIYLSISGFGNLVPSAYDAWPAYAPIVEAMSGLYEYRRTDDTTPPVPSPAGALGDIGTALFGVIGLLAALRHRDQTGEGQYVDIAMLDAMVSLADVVTNFWSMGVRPGKMPELIMDSFRAADGWFILQVGREHQFERLARLINHPEWLTDPRLATRAGWKAEIESLIRPAVEQWASTRTKRAACDALAAVGVAAGPCFSAPDVIADPLVQARHMLVEMPRTDGIPDPILIPGNPVKLSKMAEGPERRVPWLGEHTVDVLRTELELSDDELADLRTQGVIA
jgi:crotonobetainyl-CoA:carnitine CoA-transferase CaiB-like acyl-CoA transferase